MMGIESQRDGKGRSEIGRRLLDLAVAIVLLLILAPVLMVLAIAIRLDSSGPAFFRQERIGRGGRAFRILKFRTMRVDAESRGVQITIGRDPRITRVGEILRRYKLDELPQLLNILRGEMSWVGPRPEVPRYVALYTAEQREILEYRPGLTGPASLKFSDESSLLAEQPDPERYYREVLIPAKIAEDLAYLSGATLLSDAQLLAKTFRRIAGF